MGKLIYEALDILFGGGLVDSMTTWMSRLYSSIINMMEGSVLTTAMTTFSAIACTALILYFLMDLYNQVSRELFSFEKLIVSFIKLFVAFIVLLYLQDIIVQVCKMGQALYNLCKSTASGSIRNAFTSGSSTGMTYFGYDEWPEWARVKTSFEREFKGIGAIIKNIQLLLIGFVASIIGFIAKMAGYFICTSNAVMTVARAVFCPFAIVQLFEDGTRSSGARYLKGLVADFITMAVIVIILLASNALTANMVSTLTTVGSEITVDNISDIITFQNLLIILVPELAAVGGMASGSKIAHEIMGA